MKPHLYEIIDDDGQVFLYLWLTDEQASAIGNENPHVTINPFCPVEKRRDRP